MRVRIFVSYSSQDGKVLREPMCAELERYGFEAWSDQSGIDVTKTITESLLQEIRCSSACVACVTKGWVDSAWCQAELGAFRLRDRMLAALVQGSVAPPPLLDGHLKNQSAKWVCKGLAEALGLPALLVVDTGDEVRSLADAIAGWKPGGFSPARKELVEAAEGAHSGPVLVLVTNRAATRAETMLALASLSETSASLFVASASRELSNTLMKRLKPRNAHVHAVGSENPTAFERALSNWIGALPRAPEVKLDQLEEQVTAISNATKEWARREGDELRRLARELSFRLDDFSKVHGIGLLQQQNMLDRLTHGIFDIYDRDEIYEHDAAALAALERGEVYWSTHPTSANPRSETSASYRQYREAIIASKKRGVDVVRIYIVEDDTKLPPSLEEEIRQMNISEIRTYIARPSDLNRERAEDFVIIGERVHGRGIPDHGEMKKSRYSINIKGNSAEYREYRAYFERLRNGARPIDLVKKPRNEPAFADRTSVVTTAGMRRSRYMAVLRTIGCTWDRGNTGCTMCDFKRHALPDIGVEELTQQLQRVLADMGAEDTHLDLLTLGSFLHNLEVPVAFRRQAAHLIREKGTIKSVLIESRSEYVRAEELRSLKSELGPDILLELGLGVETKNTELRNKILKKGLSDQGVAHVMKACAAADIGFVAYLLVKPQGIRSDEEAIADAVESAQWIVGEAKKHGTKARIAFEPVFITKDTVLEREYLAGRYTLLNLWAVVEVAKRTASLGVPIFIGMSDEGLSDHRTPGGCGAYDEDVKAAIQAFNKTNDPTEFDSLPAECERPRF
ncbi:MAG: TIR domain-containing protein [Myxococcota bacterium]